MTTSPEVPSGLIKEAVRILCEGGLVAYPTDTLYGLAALPTDSRAVRSLFEAKKRPAERAVPLLIASPSDLATLAQEVPETAQRLIRAFWPGPLTIVLRTAAGFRSLAVRETVALRVPDHPVPQRIVRLLGAPITGTSANVSGGPDPLTAEEARRQLGEAVDLVIDGGECPGGAPSTVVDCAVAPARVVRAGAISSEELARAAGVGFSRGI